MCKRSKHIIINIVGFLIFILSDISYAQNYSKVDSIVNLYPKNIAKIEDLISKIDSDFSIPSEKVRAVFYWITHTISYDVEFAKKMENQNLYAFSYKTNAELIQKEKKFNNELAIKTFYSKTAVCYGYSVLFSYLVDKLGLDSKLVRGNLKSDPFQIGNSLEINHGWNVVKINNKWMFVDCTLAAGKISSNSNKFVFDYNDIYFFTSPELFFLNHYPDDEKWLFIEKKTKLDYQKLPLYYADFFKLNQNSFILPREGIVSSQNPFRVTVNKLNLDIDYFEYKFSGEQKRSLIELNQDTSNYEIVLNDKINQILFIYFEGKIIAAYKIR